jgi:glutaredoxin
MVKLYLSRKNIPFTERNVSLEEDARDDLMGMGLRSTPVTVIGDETVVGYSPPKLDAALKAAGIV